MKQALSAASLSTLTGISVSPNVQGAPIEFVILTIGRPLFRSRSRFPYALTYCQTEAAGRGSRG